MNRLRSMLTSGSLHEAQAPLNLRIDDLQGSRVLSIDGVGPLIDASLPGGTYHVIAQRGNNRRAGGECVSIGNNGQANGLCA